MARRSAYWLFLPLVLAGATALDAEQLIFLGYDLRGLIERARVGPASPPAEGLAYAWDDDDADWQPRVKMRLTAAPPTEIRLGYEIADLVQLATPPTLARHRL